MNFIKQHFLKVAVLSFMVSACIFVTACDTFFADGKITEEQVDAYNNNNSGSTDTAITGLKLSSSKVDLEVGGITYLTLTTTPSTAKSQITVNWKYDDSIISVENSSNNAVIKGLKEGQTSLIAEYGGYSAICIITVSGYTETYTEDNPYIYSNTSIIQLSPNAQERFYVSLAGGSVADVNGFKWSIDNPSVASIHTSGQYCDVTGLSKGYARITVTHDKAPSYPYYIGIYVFDSVSDATYITSSDNIVTLYKNDGDKTINVSLANTSIQDYQRDFNWEIVDDTGSISIVSNYQSAVITPVAEGVSTLRVTHPLATGGYPLDIVIRVIEIVENVYIQPSETMITINGTEEKTLSAELVGLKEGSEYSVDDFSFSVSNDEVFSSYSFANNIVLKGLKNGAANVIISHPKSEKDREVLVVVEGQVSDALDTEHYITTSQNYVKTKVGATETAISISLRGGSQGDEEDFHWSVIQNPDSGTQDVIRLTTTNGSTTSALSSLVRMLSVQTYAEGTAYIEPLSEGSATIILSHPKAYYDTEILIKVLSADAILEDPLYFSGSSIVRFLNSEEYTYEVTLSGTSSDENNIQWSIDNNQISLLPSGKQAVLRSSASGANVSKMSITHPKVMSPKDVLVLTADTAEELSSIKALYADKYYHSVNKGDNYTLSVNTIGYSEEDFSTIQWTTSNSSVAIVDKSSNPLLGTLTALSSGECEIKASYAGLSVIFYVTVYPEDVDIGAVESTVYLTTSNNVIVIDQPTDVKQAYVSAIGLTSSQANSIQWTSADTSIATVIANGTSATISATGSGETEISVSHPLSENTLTLYVRVGERFVDVTEPVVYISTSAETISLTKDAGVYQLSSVLVNSDTQNSFSFSIDNSSIARIESQYATGTCFIKPVSAGIAELTVSNPYAVADKKVLVIIGNTAEELEGFKYLTTSNNVVTVSQGSTKTISASIKNSDTVYLSGFSWTSENPSIAGITATTAATAVVSGNEIGTTRVSISHSSCSYPLEIIVQVVDPLSVFETPYLTTSTSILMLSDYSNWKEVSAELVGGSDTDIKDMVWNSSNSSVVQVMGNDDVAQIRGVSEGTAYIEVDHPKAPYVQRILVIVEEPVVSNCSISVSENIISMKPSDSTKSITATLINGSTEDKVNFRWSVDVYDVIDLVWNANSATITPLQEGQATITISHPKSAYDQQIIVRVSEHSSFAFASTTKTLTEGKTSFVSMQIPASSIATHVEYSSDSPLVATAMGTSAVCQITGLSAGTTIIRAKLVATNTNVTQAQAEILVSVEEGSSNLVYITTSATIYTMEKGTNKTLSATLTGTGVIATDQYNLQWKSDNENIVSIKGTSTTGIATGQSVYVEALEAGETTITISHEKSNTNLMLYIIVPGDEEKTVKLDKTFVTIEKGQSTEIKATISDGNTDDYNSLQWTVGDLDGTDVVRLMGSGNTVSAYGLSAGTVTIRAQLPNGKYADCYITVEDAKSFSFGMTTVRVQPGKSKTIDYILSPASAGLTWVQSEDTYFTYADNGNTLGSGQVTITGIKEGTSTLTCVTSYGNKATLQVVCAWDYAFSVNKTKLQGEPDEVYEITYTVHPEDAEISVDDSNIANIIAENNGDGTGIIRVTPTKEGSDSITVSAYNAATKETFGSKLVALDFEYENLTLLPEIISQNGSFSRYENGILYLGDGESVEFGISFAEEKLTYAVSDIRLENINASYIPSIATVSGFSNIKIISHPYDTAINGYIIPEWHDVYQNGVIQNPWGAYWSYTFMTGTTSDSIYASNYCLCTYFLTGTITGTSYDKNDVLSTAAVTTVRNPDRDGEWVSESTFENSYWHRPALSCRGHVNSYEVTPFWNELYFMDVVASAIPDSTLQSTQMAKMVVTILRQGQYSEYEIPVYIETRNCAFDFVE